MNTRDPAYVQVLGIKDDTLVFRVHSGYPKYGYVEFTFARRTFDVLRRARSLPRYIMGKMAAQTAHVERTINRNARYRARETKCDRPVRQALGAVAPSRR